MKAGPKAPVTVGPLTGRGLPPVGPDRVVAWCERYLRVPKGVGAGKPLVLRDFQREIVAKAYAPGVRTALASLPRANGKTGLAAALAVRELFDGPEGAEALIVASDQRQAEITLRAAKRMIDLDPRLSSRVQVYRDRIVEPRRGAMLAPLPADPAALHGWDPSLLVVDELHVVTEAVWEAVTSAAGKRAESLTLAISTPAASRDSVMWRLVEHGRAGEDPSFALAEWGAPPGADLDDEAVWASANPALHDFLAVDGLRSVRRTLRPSTFARLRLGMWSEDETAWITWADWAARADAARVVPDGETVVLAFDGSASGDSTALVACTVDAPHLFVLGLWENPGDPRWRVPREEVGRAVDAAFERFDVQECAVDPWGWRAEQQQWADRHGETRVVEWNTADARRMAPATDRLYQAVQTGTVTHDGDSRLAAHVAHCVAKSTALGDLVSKDKRHSPRKIDAAVAAIVAADRAAWHAAHRRPKRKRVVSW